LDKDCTTTELITKLEARYPDPVQALIALLDDVMREGVALDEDALEDAEARDARWRMSDAHQRALDTLLALGTRESLTYVLSRLVSYYWYDRAIDDLSRDHGPLIKATALEVWPALGWAARAEVAAFLSALSLVDEGILAFVMAVAPAESEDVKGYLQTLGDFYDSRVLPRIEAILGQVYDMRDVRDTQDTEWLARVAVCQFLKLDVEPGAELRRQAEVCGVRFEQLLRLKSQCAWPEQTARTQP
jgi:hypothetical protein